MPTLKTAMPTTRKKPPQSCATPSRRGAAAVEVARSLPVPFTFVARAENLIRDRPDLDDTIRRLQAFEQAGADVLYAPGLRDLATMRIVVQAVGKPLNVRSEERRVGKE